MKRFRISARVLSLALIMLLVTMTAMPALAASKKNPGGAYVVSTSKRDRLRVHSSPGGSVEDYLKRGTVVVFKSAKNGWWKVSYRGGSGYVYRSGLTSVAKLPKAKYTAAKDNVRVRLEPKAGAAVIGKIKAGMKVKIVKQKKSWVCVSYKGHKGWVGAIYLRRI